MLALARYALSRGKALSRAGDWLESHGMGDLGLTSQRVSDLLASLTGDRANAFFKAWMSRCPKDDTSRQEIQRQWQTKVQLVDMVTNRLGF